MVHLINKFCICLSRETFVPILALLERTVSGARTDATATTEPCAIMSTDNATAYTDFKETK